MCSLGCFLRVAEDVTSIQLVHIKIRKIVSVFQILFKVEIFHQNFLLFVTYLIFERMPLNGFKHFDCEFYNLTTFNASALIFVTFVIISAFAKIVKNSCNFNSFVFANFYRFYLLTGLN